MSYWNGPTVELYGIKYDISTGAKLPDPHALLNDPITDRKISGFKYHKTSSNTLLFFYNSYSTTTDNRPVFGVYNLSSQELIVKPNTPIDDGYTDFYFEQLIVLASGNILITNQGRSISNSGVYGQVFDHFGNILQTNFKIVNVPPNNVDYSPSITEFGDNRVMVTYTNWTIENSPEVHGLIW